MEDLIIEFIKTYGLPLGLIAIAGVVLLCILKKCNVFKKLEEKLRHVVYIAIAVAFSLIAAAIYLLATGAFSAEYFFAIAAALFTLDQAAYAIIKATPVGDWTDGLIDKIIDAIKKKLGKKAADPPATNETEEKRAESAQNDATTAESTDGAQQNE